MTSGLTLIYLQPGDRPVPHSDLVPIPPFCELPQLSEDESCMSAIAQGKESGGSASDFQTTSHSERFDQNELSDLLRDLNLSKESSELLASRLKEKNVLQTGTKITFYRRREKDLLPFFTKDNNVVFCNDIGNLKKIGLSEYNPSEWRLFIDSSKHSLKCVLLNNGNRYGSIPVGHATRMKEEYKAISLVLEKINYQEHPWVICVALKMVNFILGQQSGCTKFPCFLCLWESRAKHEHWARKDWPLREYMVVGGQNVINEPLVA